MPVEAKAKVFTVLKAVQRIYPKSAMSPFKAHEMRFRSPGTRHLEGQKENDHNAPQVVVVFGGRIFAGETAQTSSF